MKNIEVYIKILVLVILSISAFLLVYRIYTFFAYPWEITRFENGKRCEMYKDNFFSPEKIYKCE